MTDGRDAGRGSWASWGLGGLVVVYFGFPAVWIWLIEKGYGTMPPQWVLYLVKPLEWLMGQIPLYANWLGWGCEMFGVHCGVALSLGSWGSRYILVWGWPLP